MMKTPRTTNFRYWGPGKRLPSIRYNHAASVVKPRRRLSVTDYIKEVSGRKHPERCSRWRPDSPQAGQSCEFNAAERCIYHGGNLGEQA